MLIDLYKKHSQFVHYSIIGVSGVILDLITFLILFNILGVNPVVATCISVLVGITNNFILNSRYNFKKRDQLLLRYLSFLTVGLSGLLISTFILAFGEVFALDVNLMKLISLPIIVFYQYFLNKTVSFQEISPKTTIRSIAKSVITKHWGLLLINIIFIVSTLFFVKMIPFEGGNNKYDAGPDESVHYSYNVEFLLNNHRLPVSGKDDVIMLGACDVREFGIVPCTYSYQIFPAANYIFSATTAQIVSSFNSSVSPVTGARLSAVIWGVIFLNFLYLIAHRLTKNKRVGWAVATLALIPQVIFTFSYVNQDAHSMAISAICIYALVRLLQDKSKASIVIASLSFGALLPITKYNFFVLIPFIGIVLFLLALAKQISFKILFKVLLGSLAAFLVFSSFWYIRNYILYHDPFGQDFIIEEMAKYAPLGHAAPFSRAIVETYTQLGFFETTFRSFFVALGSMAHYLSEGKYAVLQALLLFVLGIYIYIMYITKNTRTKVYLGILLAAFLGLLAALLALAFYNSLKYNFQPQGRYLYPVLAPLAACLAIAYTKDKHIKYVLVGIIFIVGYCLFTTIDLVMRNYLITY